MSPRWISRSLMLLLFLVLGLVVACAEQGPGLSDEAPSSEPEVTGEADVRFQGVEEEALVSEDVGPTVDAEVFVSDLDSSLDSSLDVPAEVSTGMEPPPTWWDCRRAVSSGSLDPTLVGVCDALHTTPPGARVYGIRWVVLDEALDLETWMAPRLEALNTLFAPAEISFVTSSVVTVEGGLLKDPNDGEVWTLEQLTWDTAQLLELAPSGPQGVLDALRDRLLDAGVSTEAVADLGLGTSLEGQPYLRTIARARPEEIHVVVAPLLAGHTGGGLSSGPGPNPIGRTVSVVNVRSADAVADVVLAHEMGHFFGLRHPHAKLEEASKQPAYDFETAVQTTPIQKDLVEVLQGHLGSDLSGDPGELYPPYDAPLGGVINPMTEVRYAIAVLWLAPRQTYRMDAVDGPVPFVDIAEFIQAAVSGEAIYYKNWMGTGIPNNCQWHDELDMFGCDLGVPPALFPGDSLMLSDSILFEGGQRFDVMTYIGKTLSESQLLDWSVFAPASLPVMRIHANTPVRLMLRNHALELP